MDLTTLFTISIITVILWIALSIVVKNLFGTRSSAVKDEIGKAVLLGLATSNLERTKEAQDRLEGMDLGDLQAFQAKLLGGAK